MRVETSRRWKFRDNDAWSRRRASEIWSLFGFISLISPFYGFTRDESEEGSPELSAVNFRTGSSSGWIGCEFGGFYNMAAMRDP